MDVIAISNNNRNQINDFIRSHWFSTDMVIRGKIVDITRVEGFAMYEMEAIYGQNIDII